MRDAAAPVPDADAALPVALPVALLDPPAEAELDADEPLFTNSPPPTDCGDDVSVVPLEALIYAATDLAPEEAALMAPAMPSWQWPVAVQ